MMLSDAVHGRKRQNQHLWSVCVLRIIPQGVAGSLSSRGAAGARWDGSVQASYCRVWPHTQGGTLQNQTHRPAVKQLLTMSCFPVTDDAVVAV